MPDITNTDRSAWAAEAIDAFTAVCRMDGEDNQTKAKDLVTNLVHYLRMECGLSFEEASTVVQNAVTMAEQETEEDFDGEEEPLVREYGIRLWATLRGEYEYTVHASSLEDAIAKAKAADHTYCSFKVDSVDGDQTAHVFGPDDDNPEDDDAWGGNGVEIDMREPGEPFSWDACQLVKDLAKLSPIAELLSGNDMNAAVSVEQLGVVAKLIARAEALCAKE
ncbi:hypothetical protein [Rhizobium sp. SSA_523]|uniref:hypothetical protein n=1 Tax=Rhizobium sp. SSA_523 TaxID=2952477 RepID=UPI0020913553|nr:hypothetical protein [Rhizobium sp. SSA_523]MCO5730114.1 hypothetical protein [Rhizobium sp. SSA_523]WKC25179.1 hypothetical protein QTJ18_14420 [Rhizobium sp. SSA_523]